MKIESKAWDWSKVNKDDWRIPCEESYYLVDRWASIGYKKFLDLGCGRGRHSIQFSKSGFDVSSIDLSDIAVHGLNEWATNEGLVIDAQVHDMLELPYEDNYFDCMLSYNVISHTDTIGIKKIIAEIKRVVRSGGEVYLTLCSKDMWSFKEAGFPIIDENSVIRMDDGPENGVPHFFADPQLIKELFSEFKIISIRHVQDLVFRGQAYISYHYHLLVKV